MRTRSDSVVTAIALIALLVSGCGAAERRVSAIPQLRTTAPTGAVKAASDAIRAHQWSRAETIIETLAGGADDGMIVLGLRSLMAAERRQWGVFVSVTRQLARRAHGQSNSAASRVLSRVIYAAATQPQSFKVVWGAVSPLYSRPSPPPGTREFLFHTLAAIRDLTPAELDQALSQLKLTDDKAALVELTVELIDQGRWRQAEWLLGRLEPLSRVQAWGLRARVARRRRGVDLRARWLDAVRATKLTDAQLRALIAHEDVRMDDDFVATLGTLLYTRSGCKEREQLHVISQLVRNHQRSISTQAKSAVQGLARLPITSPGVRQALVEALLRVGDTPGAARLLRPLGPRDSAKMWVLHAEVARRGGRSADGLRLAERAFELGQRSQVVVEYMVSLWERPNPKEAARWRARIQTAPTSQGDEELAQRALGALERWAPQAHDAEAVLQYAELLARQPQAVSQSHSGALFRDRLIKRSRMYRWKRPAFPAMMALAESPWANARLISAAIDAALRNRKLDEGLTLWRRLRALGSPWDARRHQVGWLAGAINLRDGHRVAQWLHATRTRPARAGGLGLHVARVLLESNHRVLGRSWAEAALLSDPLTSWPTLPSTHEPRQSPGRQTSSWRPNLSDLSRLVRAGAGDLVLRHLDEAPTKERHARATQLRWALLRVDASVAAGKRGDAERILRAWTLKTALPKSHKLELLRSAERHQVCSIIAPLAKELVVGSSIRGPRSALSAGLKCAAANDDRAAAFRLIQAMQRAQLRLSHHLHAADQLVKHGFPKLAVFVYEKSTRGQSPTRHRSHLLMWSRALMSLERSKDAKVLLTQMIQAYGGHASAWRKAIATLEEFGDVDGAIEVAQRAQRAVPTDAEVAWALVRLSLVARQLVGLEERLTALSRAGANPRVWDAVLQTAADADAVKELHRALGMVDDSSRAFERFRIRVAAAAGELGQVQSSMRKLRRRGTLQQLETVRALSAVGQFHGARAAAEDLLSAPPSGAAAFRGELNRLNAAIQAGRTPSDPKAALELARLAIGRSLDPARTAVAAAEALELAGHVTQSAAVGAYALAEQASPAPQLLCEQGRREYAAGRRQLALRRWRRAVALTALGRRSARRGFGRPQAQECLIEAASQAREHEELRRWVQGWIGANPQDTLAWAALVRLESELARHEQAVATLMQAAATVRVWDKARFQPLVQELILRGKGERLMEAALDESQPLRSEPWWLATLVELCATDRRTSCVNLRADTVQAAANDLNLRTALALVALGRGDRRRARQLLSVHLKHGLRMERSVRGQEPSSLIKAIASLWIAERHRREDRREDSPSTEPKQTRSAGSFRTMLTQSDHVSRSLLAEELVIQGAPELAVEALPANGASSRRLPDPEMTALLRVMASRLDDKTLLTSLSALAGRREVRRSPGQRRANRTQWTRLLLAWGRPVVAARWSHNLPASQRQALPKWFLRESERLAAASKPASQQAARGDDERLQEVKFDVTPDAALMRGDSKMWIAWTRRRAAHLDEPWRAWLDVAERSVVLGQPAVLRRALREAQTLGAPRSRTACLRLLTSQEAGLKRCLQGRNPLRLAAHDLIGAAAGAARSRAQPEVADLLRRLGDRGATRVSVWLAAVASSLPWVPPHKARDLVQDTLDAVSSPAEKVRVLHASIDDLAALKVTDEALADAKAAYRTMPHGVGHKNNLAYMWSLQGTSLARAYALASEARRHRAGQSAAALLDTQATNRWAAGERQLALRTQRMSLLASRTNSEFSYLPLVRYAEFLLAAGKPWRARVMARWALELSEKFLERISALHLSSAGIDLMRAQNLLTTRRAAAVWRASFTRSTKPSVASTDRTEGSAHP